VTAKGDYVAKQVADAIARVGEPGTLIRLATRTMPRVEVTLKCVPTFVAPGEAVGGVVQGRIDVRVSNKEIAASGWPAPIRRGDQIIIAATTYTVQGVQVAAPGGVIAEHIMQVMGMA
jgi:hypothetical protein